MIKGNFHTHTCFCDGADTPETMAERALMEGFTVFGFSGHSYVPFDNCCMSPSRTEAYILEVRRLKDVYDGRLQILLGTEQDYFSIIDRTPYDYVIGSVHYLPVGEGYAAVDDTAEKAIRATREFFGGDPYRFVRAYYELVARLFERVDADIIGHIDLVTKFQEREPYFDTGCDAYRRCWQEAVEALLPYRKPFEINTGAMSRGMRRTPYPSPEILRFIRERGGSIVINSDAHSADGIGVGREEAVALARACGFCSQLIPDGQGGLTEAPLII